MDKLNIGCGREVLKGWYNLDSHDTLGADIVWNLNELPLPIYDNSFDYVLCKFVLEDFVNPVPLMEEMIRITKPGGFIDIWVAHETSCWDNLTHKRGYTLKCLKDYPEKADYGVISGVTRRRVEVVKSCFTFHRPGGRLCLSAELFIVYQQIMAFFCNLLPSDVIDYTFLKYIFAGVSIRVVYEKK